MLLYLSLRFQVFLASTLRGPFLYMAVNLSSENFQVLIFFSKLSMRRDYAHLKSTDVYRHVS